MSLVCVVLLCATPAHAQTCQDLETVLQCWERVTKTLSEQLAEQGAKVQDDVKKKTETGILDTTNGLNSSVKDFLPLLKLTGVLGAVTQDEKTGVIAVALNTPFVGNSGVTRDPTSQLQALIQTKPVLFGALKDALPKDSRADIDKTLLEGTDHQHVTLEWSLNLTSQRLGRAFRLHGRLLNALFQEAVTSSLTSRKLVAQSSLIRDIDQLMRPDLLFNTSLMREVTPKETMTAAERRRAIESAIVAAVRNDLNLNTAFDAAVRSAGIDLFGQLVNNQPQLHIRVSRTFRNDIFGPDAIAGRVTYEMGLGNNLNAFMDSRTAGSSPCVSAPAACLADFRAFTGSPEVKAHIKAGSRLAVYIEFNRYAPYDFVFAESEVNLNFEKTTGVSFGADFGRLIRVHDDGTAEARIDASIRYELPAYRKAGNKAGDTLSSERLLASFTFTKKFGDVSVPFGLSYANKGEFLIDVDHKLTANVGLKFNLFPGR